MKMKWFAIALVLIASVAYAQGERLGEFTTQQVFAEWEEDGYVIRVSYRGASDDLLIYVMASPENPYLSNGYSIIKGNNGVYNFCVGTQCFHAERTKQNKLEVWRR